MLLCYAGLIGRSRWQDDEYLDFALLRDQGWGFEVHRLLHWSPRPWSEALFMVYGSAVNHVHRPLAGSFAVALWTLLGLACLAPAWFGTGDHGERPRRMLLGLVLLSLCFVGHPVAEIFYWPAGSVAYVPTLAALCWLFWCLFDGLRDPPGRKIAAAAILVLAAGCSEVGLFLTLCFVGSATLWICAGWMRAGSVPNTSPVGALAPMWWLVPGLAVAIVLATLLLRGRVGTSEMPDTAHTLHLPWPSLLAALPTFLRELVSGSQDAQGGAATLANLTSRILLVAGARWCVMGMAAAPRRVGSLLPALAAALLLAGYATLAAAYYQFGEACCQRHEAMRGCFVSLALVCLGAWSAMLVPRVPARPGASRVRPGPGAPMALLAAVLLPFAMTIPAMTEAYRLYPAAIRARAQTWQSGLATASDSMTLVRGPAGGLVPAGDYAPLGTTTLTPDSPWYIQGMLRFFNKRTMHVVQGP